MGGAEGPSPQSLSHREHTQDTQAMAMKGREWEGTDGDRSKLSGCRISNRTPSGHPRLSSVSDITSNGTHETRRRQLHGILTTPHLQEASREDGRGLGLQLKVRSRDQNLALVLGVMGLGPLGPQVRRKTRASTSIDLPGDLMVRVSTAFNKQEALQT